MSSLSHQFPQLRRFYCIYTRKTWLDFTIFLLRIRLLPLHPFSHLPTFERILFFYSISELSKLYPHHSLLVNCRSDERIACIFLSRLRLKKCELTHFAGNELLSMARINENSRCSGIYIVISVVFDSTTMMCMCYVENVVGRTPTDQYSCNRRILHEYHFWPKFIK